MLTSNLAGQCTLHRTLPWPLVELITSFSIVAFFVAMGRLALGISVVTLFRSQLRLRNQLLVVVISKLAKERRLQQLVADCTNAAIAYLGHLVLHLLRLLLRLPVILHLLWIQLLLNFGGHLLLLLHEVLLIVHLIRISLLRRQLVGRGMKRHVVLLIIASVVPNLLVVWLRFGILLLAPFFRLFLRFRFGCVDFNFDICIVVGGAIVLDLVFDSALDIF